MPTRKLVPKYNATKLRGQHRCNHCGKDIPIAIGLKLHIANSKHSGCREQWDCEVLQKDPTESPSPPATSNNADHSAERELQYDWPMLEAPPKEPPTFIPSERHPVSPNLSSPEPPSKQARVEETDDEEASGCPRWAQEFEGAAEELGEGKTLFEELHEQQEAMCEAPMAPFVDEEEWELARWLIKNVTQTVTDKFLKMKGVSSHA